MSGILVVGDPKEHSPDNWWEKSHIWVVPGAVPSGPPGVPKSDTPNFVWTRLTNKSEVDATDVAVRFYFSPSASCLVRDKAVIIGDAFVTLPPGGQEDVVCLAAWTPQFAQNDTSPGCLIVEADHYLDRIPAPLSTYFDPWSLTQVAIRNVHLHAVPAAGETTGIKILVPDAPGLDNTVTVSIDDNFSFGDHAPSAFASFGLDASLFRAEKLVDHKLQWVDRSGAFHFGPELTMTVPYKSSETITVLLSNSRPVPGRYQLVRIVERRGGTKTGGVSLLVLSR